MPFAKGQSGNPGGRPKKIPAFVARFRALEPKALKFLERLIGNDKADPKDRLKAIEIAFAYSRGKPRQQLELSGPGGEPLALEIGAQKLLADPNTRSLLQQIILEGGKPK